MNIKEFFEQSAGKWFVQRTSYTLDEQKAASSKSEIVFEFLQSDDTQVTKLCEQLRVKSDTVWGGAKISWDNSVDWGKDKQVGFNILVPVPDVDNPNQGRLLRLAQNQPTTGIAIRYEMGEDDALVFIAESEHTYSEERLWFASSNLRLRSCLEKHAGGYQNVAFYSEIKRIENKEEGKS